MKVLAWYIDRNGIENKNTVKDPYPTGIKKCEILILDTQMVLKKKKKKRRYQSNAGNYGHEQCRAY